MTGHLDDEALLAYWLGETSPEASEAADAHLLACDACGARVDALVALVHGVREAFARGAVPAMLSAGFVERLKAQGRRVREYRVPRNGSVHCSVAPEDDLLVSRVAAPLAGVQRLDAEFSLSLAPGQATRLDDIPFDPAAGEVVFAPPLAEVRALPSHELVLRLIAVDAAGERELGRYTFHHQAHGAGG
jgi:anti-sigma factor RsiW